GSAAQLMSIQGRAARGEYSCTARAITSFPQPLSPVIRTAALLFAILSTDRSTARMRALEITAGIPRNENIDCMSPAVLAAARSALTAIFGTLIALVVSLLNLTFELLALRKPSSARDGLTADFLPDADRRPQLQDLFLELRPLLFEAANPAGEDSAILLVLSS